MHKVHASLYQEPSYRNPALEYLSLRLLVQVTSTVHLVNVQYNIIKRCCVCKASGGKVVIDRVAIDGIDSGSVVGCKGESLGPAHQRNILI